MSAYFAHPKALIDQGATIGKNTRIWAFAHILPKARIGARCNIGDYVFVENGVVLGNDVTVKNGIHLWDGVKVENGVFIGPGCVFTNHRVPRAFIKRPASVWLEKTILKEGCTLGARSTILCGTTIGRFAFVAAGALVTKDVPDFALVLGSPATFHSWRCFCGFPLIFKESQAYCKVCKEQFILDAKRQTLHPRRPQSGIQKALNRRLKRVTIA